MNKEDSVRRQLPPLLIWLGAGAVAVAIAACAVLALFAWQEAQQIEALQAQVETLRAERQNTEAHLIALQSTATVMENRLATLEANDPAQQLAALQAAVETANDSEELATVRTSLTEVQSTVSTFQSTLDDLSSRLAALEPEGQGSAESLPVEKRLTVTRQRQSHNLSCESSAASMVAQFHGVNLSEAQALASLPLNDNPHLGFRGNVDGPTGGIEDYGVYAGPVVEILNSQGLQAWPMAGGLSGIRAAIARGNPVIAWITYNCLPSTPTLADIDGQQVTLVPNQHVVVVTGYNADGVWANDPWDGQEDFYANADFERAMGYFDNMAIEVAVP